MKLIKKYLLPHRAAVICCVIILVFQAAFSLAMPYFMGQLIGVGIHQKGVDAMPPEILSINSLQLFESVMPEDEYAELSSMYERHDRCPEGMPEEFEIIRKCYYLKEDADKDRTRELYETAVFSGIIVARGKAEDVTEKDGAELFSKYASIVMLNVAIRQSGLDKSDFEEAYLQAQSAQQALKTQIAAMLLPYIYDDAGVDIEELQEKYIAECAALMVGAVILQLICTVATGKISANVSSRVQRDIRADFLKHTAGFSAKELADFPPSFLEGVAVRDIEHIGMLISYGLRIFAFAPILAVGGTALSFAQSPVFGSLILITAATITAALAVLYFATVKTYDKLQEAYGKFVKLLQDNLAQLFTVRSNCAEKYEEARASAVSEKIRKNENYVLRSVYIAMSVITLISNIVTAVLVVAGGEQLLSSSLGIGDVVAFLQYSVVTVSAFLMFGAVIVLAPRAAVAAKNVSAVMSAPISVVSGDIIPDENEKWDVEFRNVSVRGGEVSFTAKSGELTALVGATGCGKSTLLSYITRFAQPESGEIFIGGRDIKAYNLEALRRNVSFAQSKPVLFSKTLRENLLLHGAPDDAQAMLLALKSAKCDFIASKKEDLSKYLINRGDNFSGGQKSRIAVAGALAKKAKVYVFDDCLTAVDTETEAAIMQSFAEKCGGAAVLLVSQRISSVMRADKIVVISESGTLAQGTHDELMRSSGFYRELAELQQKGACGNGQ